MGRIHLKRDNYRYKCLAWYLLTAAVLPLCSAMFRTCKTIPSDATWPSLKVWQAFNESVDGRLIHTTPVAEACHHPSFSGTQCETIRNQWHDASFHEQSSSSVMSAPFANRSCDPFDGPSGPCSVGTYVEYTVNASTQAHVSKTVLFARRHNIRFVVRNSAHDYMGKSTGHGALAIWMHHLTETEWIKSYSSPGYRGPAVKAQAGVSVMQIYEEASAHGFTVVGGACPTVGFAGGFIQGGGHGPLSSIYGLGADDTLAFEVVTTNGAVVTATATENSELFWALSGGGPGTYAILWSVTVKVHPDMPVTGATVSFATSNNVSLDQFWKGVDAYRSMAPNITAAGGYTLAIYLQGTFELAPLLLPNQTAETANTILRPFLSTLKSNGIPFTSNVTTFPGFLQAYTSTFDPAAFAIANAQIGGRLLPRSSWRTAASLRQLNSAIRNIVDDGAGAYDIVVAPALTGRDLTSHAIFPAWRQAQTTLSLFMPWDDLGTAAEANMQQHKITNVYMPAMKRITPESGAYLNEADAFDPDWKETFYGVNYNRLLRIKDKWDEAQLLYGGTAVGGDRWRVEPSDGRLCPI